MKIVEVAFKSRNLNSRSNLALPFSWSLFVHFPRSLLPIIINLIVRRQPVPRHLQNIFQEMSVNWICKSLIKTMQKLFKNNMEAM